MGCMIVYPIDMETIVCKQCGKSRESRIFWARFCNDECRTKYHNERRSKERKAKRGESCEKPMES